ncbi:MAG: hypothetical protein KAJ42_07480 [Gemmatimonadetes bacterium]|nr:hypothetical protein [Gemmatimonadota bacterium]
MGVSDANAVYGDNARFTHKPISVYVETVAVSQTALELFQHTPGYAFQIVGFTVYAVSVTAVVSLNLLIGSTSVITAVLVPVAAAEAAATIKSDGSEYGADDDIVYIQTTTDGAGDVTGANINIWIRRRAQDVS